MISSYGVGQYLASEAHCCVQSRLCRPGARGIVFFHAFGGNALDVMGLGSGVDLSPLTKSLADLNVPILGGDVGGGDTWGNAASQSAATNLASYVQSAFGAKSGKVIAMGCSMGGMLALNWARANPTLVNAVVLFYPAVNLQALWNGTGGAESFQSFIQTAYGGTPDFATYDPASNAASYTNSSYPIRMYYSTADTVVGSANQTAWLSAVGGSSLSSVNLGAVAHGDMTQPSGSEVNAFLAPYL